MSKKTRRQHVNRYQSGSNTQNQLQSLAQQPKAAQPVSAALPFASKPLTAPCIKQKTPLIESLSGGKPMVTLTAECWCELVNLPSYILETDPEYQRDIRESHVQEIVEEWDSRVMNFPKVSERDGHYFIFDGAHTKTVTDRLNGSRDHQLPCIVYHGLNQAEEAYLFVKQSGKSADVAFSYKLHAALVPNTQMHEELKFARAFKDAVEAIGYVLPYRRGKEPCTISAVKTAYRLYERIGHERFVDAMSLLMDTWRGEEESTSQVMLEGLTLFMNAYRHVYSRARFLRDLSQIDVKSLAQKGRSAKGDGYNNVACAILSAYNRKGGKGCVTPDLLMILSTQKKDAEMSEEAVRSMELQ